MIFRELKLNNSQILCCDWSNKKISKFLSVKTAGDDNGYRVSTNGASQVPGGASLSINSPLWRTISGNSTITCTELAPWEDIVYHEAGPRHCPNKHKQTLQRTTKVQRSLTNNHDQPCTGVLGDNCWTSWLIKKNDNNSTQRDSITNGPLIRPGQIRPRSYTGVRLA